MLTGVPSVVKKPEPQGDPVAKYIAHLEEKVAKLEAECEHECEEKDKEHEARMQSDMACAAANATATAERARADAAERSLASEVRRADEATARADAAMAECEQLRTKLIAQVEARARAEGALTKAPAPMQVTPPAPVGWTMTASRFDELGNIIEMTLTPKG